jgi:hypothetical protein
LGGGATDAVLTGFAGVVLACGAAAGAFLAGGVCRGAAMSPLGKKT